MMAHYQSYWFAFVLQGVVGREDEKRRSSSPRLMNGHLPDAADTEGLVRSFALSLSLRFAL